MASRDLLKNPITIMGKEFDRAEFFEKARDSLERLLAVEKLAGPGDFDPEPVQQEPELLQSHIRLLRAAVSALAGENDLDTLDFVLKLHRTRSRELLKVGEGLSLEEFSLLQVCKGQPEELKKEVEKIEKVQREITRQVTVKLSDYRDRAKPVKVRQKHNRAAFFQGIRGMADFYHRRYDS